MNQPVLSFKNVGVCYSRAGRGRKRFWALEDISFDLYAGETLGVIGRNGAGKTTLMRLMAGIIKPDAGEIHCEVDKVQLLSLQVGFMPDLTGRENAILSGILLGMRRREIEAQLNEIIDFAELHAFIDEPVGTYSSGMKARLGFAIAKQADPDILLVDEVLGVGDVVFREKSRQVMLDKMNAGETVVLVSHMEPVLRQHCKRVVWIEDGRTRMEGPCEEVLEAYREHMKIQNKQAIASLRA